MTDDELYAQLAECLRKGYQVIAHTNGSAAIGQFLDQYARAKLVTAAEEGMKPVLIHAQTITEEQLDRAEELGVDVSFFNDHTYYWGDVHRKNFGDERAMAISPTHTALEKGVLFTFHQDAPVVPPDMWHPVWCAVCRQSKGGVIMGEGERIPVLEALKAVTINGAYQYFEEKTKGSLEEGKWADLMIVDQDPLKVDPMELKDIKVLSTIKEGFTLWQAE